MALVGFTRFEAAAPDTEGELDMGVRRADLARNVTWVPAVENRGEGIFLQFHRKAIENWLGSTRQPLLSVEKLSNSGGDSKHGRPSMDRQAASLQARLTSCFIPLPIC